MYSLGTWLRRGERETYRHRTLLKAYYTILWSRIYITMKSSPLSKISVLSISQRLKLRHRAVKSVRRVLGFSSGEMHVPCHLDGTLERSLAEMSSRTGPDVVLTHFPKCEHLPTNRTICLPLFLMRNYFSFISLNQSSILKASQQVLEK